MHSLQHRQIIIGISGGIAAYKSVELVRTLTKAGCQVRVVMTSGAQAFVTPLTLQAVSGMPVHCDLLDPEAEAGMGHIELARWADLILVAPASANFIARLANGHGDDLLTTLCLATKAPIAIAPAMNQAMWHSDSVTHNIQLLQSRNVSIWGPASGEQACGDVGLGRMLEQDELALLCSRQFQTGLLAGKKVVITAGPTRERLDPVRYISNFSSGKMGYAIANSCIDAGAIVTLISGPTNLNTPAKAEVINVESAQQMLDATLPQIEQCDIFVACAAVVDYRPESVEQQKIKKDNSDPDNDFCSLSLVKNPDILAMVSSQLRANNSAAMVVGFAAETENLVENAQTKLAHKHLDLIVANDVSQEGQGFHHDNNCVTLVWKNSIEPIESLPKKQLAAILVEKFVEFLKP